MTPCVAYARVSSEEQFKAGFSIPFQRAKVEQFAVENRYDIQVRFEDVQSASHAGREGFEAMVRYFEANPRVRTVLTHKIDRASRNHIDFGVLVEHLGVRIVTVVEPAPDSPLGRAQQGMSLVFGKYHSDNLVQEVKKGLRAKFEAGGYISRAPVGYLNVPRTRTEKAKIVVDLEKAPIIRLLFERYATGRFSLSHLADELFDQGLRTRTGKPYPGDRIRRVLKDPFYVGRTHYRDEVRDGIHEPLVAKALWNAAQRVLSERSCYHGEKGTKFFLLRGILSCSLCSRNLTAEEHPKGSYYRCIGDARRDRCPAPYLPLAMIEEKVVNLLPVIAITDGRRKEIIEALRRVESERQTLRVKEERPLRARADRLRAKVLRLADLAASGSLSIKEFAQLRTRYDSDLEVVGDRLTFLISGPQASISELESILETAAELPEFYVAASHPEAKKAVLSRVFKTIVMENKEIKGMEYNPPYDLLFADTNARAGSGMSIERALLEFMASRGKYIASDVRSTPR